MNSGSSQPAGTKRLESGVYTVRWEAETSDVIPFNRFWKRWHAQGDGSSSLPARFVYTHHRKPLLGVSFIEASRLAASCDGAVHLWDPFVGTSVRQLDATSSSRYPTVTAMKALPAPNASLVVATAEGTHLKASSLR